MCRFSALAGAAPCAGGDLPPASVSSAKEALALAEEDCCENQRDGRVRHHSFPVQQWSRCSCCLFLIKGIVNVYSVGFKDFKSSVSSC